MRLFFIFCIFWYTKKGLTTTCYELRALLHETFLLLCPIHFDHFCSHHPLPLRTKPYRNTSYQAGPNLISHTLPHNGQTTAHQITSEHTLFSTKTCQTIQYTTPVHSVECLLPTTQCVMPSTQCGMPTTTLLTKPSPSLLQVF